MGLVLASYDMINPEEIDLDAIEELGEGNKSGVNSIKVSSVSSRFAMLQDEDDDFDMENFVPAAEKF